MKRWFAILLAVAAAAFANAGSGRRHLGDWIAQQPITARVMVNHIWQGHFGSGLVRSPNDFSSPGEKPTHPEFLDWLASDFAASGSSVKAMHLTMASRFPSSVAVTVLRDTSRLFGGSCTLRKAALRRIPYNHA